MKSSHALLSIGHIAKRTGCSVSAIRYYADQQLIPSIRSNAGHRFFHRSVIRRVSFVLILQGLGYSLVQIRRIMAKLPENRTPTKRDWSALSKIIDQDLSQEIARLQRMQMVLNGCIGCGCLSLKACKLYNPEDKISAKGTGARYLMGDRFADIK